ncbi:MAG: hypothetical protein ACKOI0_02990 [Actinomycetota bacterium]
MPTLLRALGSGLVVLACLFTMGGLLDDAPGLLLIASGVLGVAIYALIGSGREERRRTESEALLRKIAEALTATV